MKRACIIAAVATVSALTLTSEAATISPFTIGTPLPVVLAQELALTGINGKVYLFGGFETGPDVSTVRSYDPVLDTFTVLAPLPVVTRGACGGTFADGRMAVLGGTGSGDQLFIYDPVTNLWSNGANLAQSQGWECAAAIGGDNKLHVFGGETEKSHHSIYDITLDAWTNAADMPRERVEHGASFINGKFYVYGGANSSTAPDSLTTLDIFDPVTATWTAGAALPDLGNTQFAFTSNGSEVLVLGGSTAYGNNSAPIFGSVWTYDPVGDAWAIDATVLAAPTREAAAVIVNGNLHVFGGSDGARIATHQVSALDSDEDGVADSADNCPLVSNPLQEDADSDGAGDVCDVCPNDADDDIDMDDACGDVDNCPNVSNPLQADGDTDTIGDACDACPADGDNDVDNDGVCGDVDNCPDDSNANQADSDGDGIGDVCDMAGMGGMGGMGAGGMGAGGMADGGMGGTPGTGGTGNVNNNDTVVDDGCGCHVVGGTTPASRWALLGLLGLAAVARRRRR